MQAFRFVRTSAFLFFSTLSMTAYAEKGFYREAFSKPVPNFDTYVMERYDGNTKDSVWNVDTYKHTGPFTFSQVPAGLAITTKGYWEWDYCVIVLPSPVRVQPDDSLTMEVRVAAGSEHDSAMIGLQMGLSEKQSEDGVLFPSPQPVLVKKDWTTVSIAQKYGDDQVTHLFINIDAGYTTGPASGWFVEPNKPFSGTIEIKSITLDGSSPGTGTAKAIRASHPQVRIDGNSIRYTGTNADNLITVYDMSGHSAGSSRNAFEFKRNLKSGLYYFRISEGGNTATQGRFSLLY